MSRVDRPQLQCDRCKTITDDTSEMGKYKKLEYSHMSGREQWDLCPECWKMFKTYILMQAVLPS